MSRLSAGSGNPASDRVMQKFTRSASVMICRCAADISENAHARRQAAPRSPWCRRSHEQLVHRMFDATYFGRLSGVKRSSASPRRIAAPIESAGMSVSAGGFHAAVSNATAELPGAPGAGERSTVHAKVHATVPSQSAAERT